MANNQALKPKGIPGLFALHTYHPRSPLEMYHYYGAGINFGVSDTAKDSYILINADHIDGRLGDKVVFGALIDRVMELEQKLFNDTGIDSFIVIPEDILKGAQRSLDYTAVLETRRFQLKYMQFRSKSGLPIVKQTFVYMPER